MNMKAVRFQEYLGAAVLLEPDRDEAGSL